MNKNSKVLKTSKGKEIYLHSVFAIVSALAIVN